MRIDLTLDQTLPFTSTPTQWREMVQRAELERAESRRRALDAQWSPENMPEERIRIWEKLHALRLPRTAGHPLLAVIAKQTHLSVGDIEYERERRLQLDAAAGAE